ncbi:MAG: glycosyl hydrolase family 18, partial [Lachnospiraceae bacterium]|nr:glycosyl hydrolase family 18 [Lachnospiraceae bacterium]
GMNKIDDYLVEHNAIRNWKDDLGLNYAEFLNEDKSVTKAWIEDEKSLEEKLNLIPTNKLGGAAFWKLGFETDSVWNLVKRYTK